MTSKDRKSDRPLVLLTNDDGVQAPGLLALAQALHSLNVFVIAPDHNWSASGHSKTMHKPLRAWATELADGSKALATSGSPSDCVAMALLGLLDQTPDLIVSGVNLGANIGHDLTYSGTVAAAMEGVIGGVPAIAVSLDTYEAGHYDVAARFTAQLVERVLETSLSDPLARGGRSGSADHAVGASALSRRADKAQRSARENLLLDWGGSSGRNSRTGDRFRRFEPRVYLCYPDLARPH